MQADLIERFAAIVGANHAITDQAAIAPRLVETRGLYHGASPLLLKPGSTEDVSAILALASETRTAIVPQSGNTGHVGGQIPRIGHEDVILSLERMNRVREGRSCGRYHDSRCRLCPRQSASTGRGARPHLPAVAGLAGQLPDRGQSLDQCRRHASARLWQCPGAVSRA